MPLRGANSSADEFYPTIWKTRIAFVRTYTPKRRVARHELYWRRLGRPSASVHLEARWPHYPGQPRDLDMQGRDISFFWAYDYGGQVVLATIGGKFRVLSGIPGSGAADFDYGVDGTTTARRYVYWMLTASSHYSQVRRYDLHRRNEQASTRKLEHLLPPVSFTWNAGAAYYARPVAEMAYPTTPTAPIEIRGLRGLRFRVSGPPPFP